MRVESIRAIATHCAAASLIQNVLVRLTSWYLDINFQRLLRRL